MAGVVAILAALPMEVEGLVRLGRFGRPQSRIINYIKGDVHGVGVALVVSGMGDVLAYETAKAACGVMPVRAFISVGISAALEPGLAPGDVVVGESVSFAGSGGAATRNRIASSHSLLNAAHGALDGSGVRFGPLLASDRVAATSADKMRLAKLYGCAALDMESHGAARAASDAGIPFIAVRAVSDALEEDLPVDFNLFTKGGRLDWTRFAVHVVSHPWVIPGLMRLGRGSRLAAANIADVTGRLLPAIPQF